MPPWRRQADRCRWPTPDYLSPGSFGSLELQRHAGNEPIGQPIDYTAERAASVPMLALDTLELARVDLIKLDIEGMEMAGLAGARQTIGRHRPILIVEDIKVDRTNLNAWLTSFDYVVAKAG